MSGANSQNVLSTAPIGKQVSQRPVVELGRLGRQTVAIIPPVPELNGKFGVTAYCSVEDDVHGMRVVAKRYPDALLSPDKVMGKECLIAPAGLEQQLERGLREAGYRVKLRGYRPGPPALSQDYLASADCEDVPVLDLLQQHDRGLIRYDSKHVRVERLIAQIVQACSEARILIMATRDNDARWLGRYLRKLGLEVAIPLNGWEPEGKFRIVVTTYGGASAGIAAIGFRELALFLNPDEVFCSWGNVALSFLHRARPYGLLPIGATPSVAESTRMAALFGTESVTVLRPGLPTRSVYVVFQASRVQSSVRRDEGDWTVRQRCAWQHPVRNRKIARVAQLIAGDDRQRLSACFPDVAAKLDPWPGDRVGVLVGSVAQGLEMAKYLPGWPVLAALGFVGRRLSQSQLNKLHEVPSNVAPTSSAIVTLAALPAAGQFRCLVRADAGSGGLPNSQEQQVAVGEVLTDLLIVDFDDRHHPEMRRLTRDRKAAYQSASWRVEGGPDVPADYRLPARRTPRRCVLPYQSPRRRRWVEGPPRGSEFQYQRRRKRRREQLRKEAGGVVTIQQIADRDHLVDCFRQLQREGGPAPGIDGISPADVSMREFGCFADHLSKTLIQGSYRPQRTRRVAIDKPGTHEKRILKIGVLVDRVVGKALHEGLQPYWEQIYRPQSYGFRPGRSAWQMLAAMESAMEAENRWVLAIDDVRKAFDNVPIAKALAAHQAVTKRNKNAPVNLSQEVLRLIGVVLRGFDEDSRVGIDQGGCYSPDALNLLLHVVHDVPFSAVGSNPPWFRYADNLVYLCRSVSEGCKALKRSRSLLAKVGLSLKGKDGLADLDSGETALILGFQVTRSNGSVQFGLGDTTLTHLRQHLEEARMEPDPVEAALSTLRLWINAYGPAFKDGEATLEAITSLAAEMDLREIPGSEVLRGWMATAHLRWCTCRERVHREAARG